MKSIKKRFIPLSFGFIILNIFLWGLSILALILIILICCNVIDMGTSFDYSMCIVVALADIYLFYSSINFLFGLIINLKESEIYTYGDFYPKVLKLQYKCSLSYKDIKSAKIIYSHLNSKRQTIQLKGKGPSMPIKYIEFLLTDGKKERMAVSYYTRKQFIIMLNLINNNMKVSGNVNRLNIDEIMQEWHSLVGEKNKQIDYLL